MQVTGKCALHPSKYIPKRQFDEFLKACVCVLILSSVAAWALPLGSSARSVIPSDVQQIISVDYRALQNSDTARH